MHLKTVTYRLLLLDCLLLDCQYPINVRTSGYGVKTLQQGACLPFSRSAFWQKTFQ